MESDDSPKYIKCLLGGAFAGMVVDFALFPLDTVKTRLQSELGFWKSGGFRKIYSGIGSVAVGSAPNAALFFCTYETVKHLFKSKIGFQNDQFAQMIAASTGEAVACLIRVPTEVIKQRSQATKVKSIKIFRNTVRNEGFKGLYRGYLTTLLREIPFGLVQYPLWETLKSKWYQRIKQPLHPWQATVCGAIAGGFAAFVTTPLDVAKTRIMLAQKGSKHASGDVIFVLKSIWKSSGTRGLFSGVVPRVLWIAFGGALFLGSYDTFKYLTKNL
ncbi:S-adenosylmethionine mitochondrial carrier protein-like protein [Dinothrombium tinctorium]|uniref:S-adenosylmethionine mitochondrial carrier protein-like protein n=1 Tax=Dinothrombium tinctorium TaxID=1965070 RepID=A0A3S3SG44_9ACAR|nr:S-adenosylmethionine mitochondrial carrier protein-like protein [Dinothrombium tinctorium]RWS10125.1 S-adenosylmethionine mitochondrial carrier protein-like protein [Dinothrombium tinctorium]RWS14843.1 S-adenosylmethionine mitochondrial carrier protein-like protein [Dinothrombium tinctorium]